MTLQKLICDIKNYLYKNKDLKKALHYLVNYKSDEWKYHISLPENGYNRINLYNCDDFEIILICWAPHANTPIHDHPVNGCLMKILDGSLEEIIYDKNINKIKHLIRTKDDVNYIDNDLGYHKIKNNSIPSYSIHLYSPIKHNTKLFNIN
jgi:cysteine dioxygenase